MMQSIGDGTFNKIRTDTHSATRFEKCWCSWSRESRQILLNPARLTMVWSSRSQSWNRELPWSYARRAYCRTSASLHEVFTCSWGCRHLVFYGAFYERHYHCERTVRSPEKLVLATHSARR